MLPANMETLLIVTTGVGDAIGRVAAKHPAIHRAAPQQRILQPKCQSCHGWLSMEKNRGGANNRGVSGCRTTVFKRVNSALSVAGTLLLLLPGDHRQVA